MAPAALQVNVVAFAATPVALLAGEGPLGAPGALPVPEVVNDQIAELAIIAGFTGVANVRDTIFQ